MEVARIIGRKNEVFAAGPAIRSRGAHVGDEPEERVIDGAGAAPGGNVHHDGARVAEVEDVNGVDGVGVAGEEQRVGVHHGEDHHLVAGVEPDFGEASADAFDRRSGDAVEEGCRTPC